MLSAVFLIIITGCLCEVRCENGGVFFETNKSPRSQIMREIIEPKDEFCEDTIGTVMQIFCSNRFPLYNVDSIETSKKEEF